MFRIEIDGRGVLIGGPLEDVARKFEVEFVRRGFARKSLMNQLRLLAEGIRRYAPRLAHKHVLSELRRIAGKYGVRCGRGQEIDWRMAGDVGRCWSALRGGQNLLE